MFVPFPFMGSFSSAANSRSIKFPEAPESIKTLTLFSINFALTVAGRRQSGALATIKARNDSESIACLSGSSWLAFAMALKASLFWR